MFFDVCLKGAAIQQYIPVIFFFTKKSARNNILYNLKSTLQSADFKFVSKHSIKWFQFNLILMNKWSISNRNFWKSKTYHWHCFFDLWINKIIHYLKALIDGLRPQTELLERKIDTQRDRERGDVSSHICFVKNISKTLILNV